MDRTRMHYCLLLLPIGICGCAPDTPSGMTFARNNTATADAEKDADTEGNTMTTAENASTPLDFVVKSIDGIDVPLSKYKGKVVLIVNVASKCGYTSQYKELQRLHENYAARGLAILGFPANNFLWQEPGTNRKIKHFCSATYGIQFDMFAKTSVKGRNKCELYRFLTSNEKNAEFGGEVKWNFTKFLLNRHGNVVGRFGPRVAPNDATVVNAIEAALDDSV